MVKPLVFITHEVYGIHMTTEQIAQLPTGTQVQDSDNETWQKSTDGMWREVGVFGHLGTSSFSSAHLLQSMGPITTSHI
jgi:hypothetical protein